MFWFGFAAPPAEYHLVREVVPPARPHGRWGPSPPALSDASGPPSPDSPLTRVAPAAVSVLTMLYRIALFLALLQATSCYRTAGMSRGAMRMAAESNRRDAVSKTALGGLALFGLTPTPAFAEKINDRLAKFGLPPAAKAPDGFTATLELYGRGSTNDRQKLLVLFNRPSLWVLVKPSVDVNGEDGTLSAGDYQKGDNAALFVTGPPPKSKIDVDDKGYIEEVLKGAISQKSVNVFENFKVMKIQPGVSENGADYVIADFKYDLLTGAGFVVERRGVGSITSVGGGTQAMVAATTASRFKKTKTDLYEVTSSFRVYDGSSAKLASLYEY